MKALVLKQLATARRWYLNNIDRLIAAGKAAFGERWQTDMSRALGVSDRTVRHWLSGKYQMPPLIFSDITKILEERKALIEEAIKMTKETYLMNPATGTVDTKENLLANMNEWEDNPEQQFAALVEVIKDESGEWVEA